MFLALLASTGQVHGDDQVARLMETIQMLFTADTRLRKASGVRTWMRVERITTLMLSNAPVSPSTWRSRSQSVSS